MANARKDGLYLLSIGLAVFVLLGLALENAAAVSTADFRLVYYSARAVLDHRDPYSESDLDRTYKVEGGETPQDTPMIRKTERQFIYPPTAFSITLPFALFPFRLAQALWLIATIATTTMAAWAMWEASSEYAPVLSGALIGLTLANCELFLAIAGPGAIAIGLCVFAAWCFIRRRLEIAGVFCLAASLMLKPHDAALVWLYFMLAGASYRKRAIQTLAAVVLLSVPSIAWVSHVAPHWISELVGNLGANGAHGSLSDPGASSVAGHGIAMIISLQTVFSLLRNDPGFYNTASYLLSGALLLIWAIRVLRAPAFRGQELCALASISALSMLPVYHRLDDAKLLLLVVPACCLLWHKGGFLGGAAAVLTTTQILFTSAIPWAIFLALIQHSRIPESSWVGRWIGAAQILPAPLVLLATAMFYIAVCWVYKDKRGRNQVGSNEAIESIQ